MRKVCIIFLVSLSVFSFTSCSNEELQLEGAPESALKSVELKRDANGKYSIDYAVTNNTVSVVRNELNSFTKEFHLTKVGFDTKESYREDLNLSENKLSVGFFDDMLDKSTKFTIEDEDISFAKGSTNKYLKTYSLTSKGDGTIQLDFEVNDNVSTTVTYNSLLGVYEVHLTKGASDVQVFSKAIDIPLTKILKIDFVNHFLMGKGAVQRAERKPRVVYDES